MNISSNNKVQDILSRVTKYIDSPLWWRYERRRLGLPQWLRKKFDILFRVYELWRVSKSVTKVLGPRFSRSRNLLEIDLTYVCSLRCVGCNRSLDQAPTDSLVNLDTIKNLINESIERQYVWKGIRLLGGEPTLHPDFLSVLDLLRDYRERYQPKLRITVVSNGYSERTKAILCKIPHDIFIENTSKTSSQQIDFAPFNNAPQDYTEHANSDFRNGCWITEGLGIGLTPQGYYYCAIAGGIDRIYGFGLGRKSIPDILDPMHEQFIQLCALCGHFCIHTPTATPADGTSTSWQNAYASWEERSRNKVNT